MKLLKAICFALASIIMMVPFASCGGRDISDTSDAPKADPESVPDTTEAIPDTTEETPDTVEIETTVPETSEVTEAPAPELKPADELKDIFVKNHVALPLWPERNTPYDIKGASVKATIAAYLVEGSDEAVVIFPGGGYFQLSVANEGTIVAQAYNKAGISAFVVTYRYKSDKDPVSAYDGRATLADGQRAVQFVRYYSEKFGIDKNKIAVCGFSAGSHLAMLTAQHTPEENLLNDVIGAESSTPNACILICPVTTLEDGSYHRMPPNFLGDKVNDAAERAKYSYGHNIEAMPDTFVAYSFRDTLVDYTKNADKLVAAMKAANKPVVLKTYNDGGHNSGLTSAMVGTEYSKWHGESVKFLKDLGF